MIGLQVLAEVVLAGLEWIAQRSAWCHFRFHPQIGSNHLDVMGAASHQDLEPSHVAADVEAGFFAVTMGRRVDHEPAHALLALAGAYV